MAVVISGTNNSDKITATDGLIDLLSSVNFASEVSVPSFKVGSDIQIGNAGIITATTLVGNVQGNINHTSNLLLQISGSEKFRVGTSGQLGIGGANYGTSGQVLTSGGSSSAATWSTISGTTINNNAANKVIMGSNTANTLEAVAKSTLFGNLNHGQNFLDDNYLIFGDASDLQLVHQSSGAKSRLRNTNDSGSLDIESSLTRFTNKDGSTEKLRIDSSGRLLIGTTTEGHSNADDLTVATSGNTGITIRSGTSNGGNIFFSDATSGTGESAGMISYDHGVNIMTFHTNEGNERLRIDSTGRVFIGGAVSADVGSDNLVITEPAGGYAGMTLRSAVTNPSQITFANQNTTFAGCIQYDNSSNFLRFFVNGANERLRILQEGSLRQTSTGSFQIAKGTAAQRPTGITGMIRYNTETNKLEYYDGSAWQTLKTTFEGLGGNSTYTFGGYKVHVFTSNGNFTVTGAGTVDALIVAGGGGAGASSRTNYNGAWAGGGGGGGVLWQQSISVASGTTYGIVIGNGGAVQNNGQNSTAFGYTAIGGGRGGGTTSAGSGNVNWNGASGGSGGGGLGDKPGPMQGGSGTSGQGNNGAPGTDPGGNPYYEQGGGGGGAGEAGDTDGYGFGGDGRDMSGEFGTSVGESGYFGGGGAGGQGTDNSASVNSGGQGGGGDSGGGYQNNSYASQAGQANTGGGGGAGGNATSGAGGQAGGSGIVLIRYAL